MNWFDSESAAGTSMEGYFGALTLWVKALSKTHVGFIPDIFPRHFYITTKYESDDEDFCWVSLFPLALWQPPKPIGEDEADLVFKLEDFGDGIELIIGAKPGTTIPAAALVKKLLIFRLAA